MAIQVNSALTLVFWQVGKRINEDILQNERAAYGKQVVANLSEQLMLRYGKNFELKNLRRMMQFANVFPDFEIVVPLARQLKDCVTAGDTIELDTFCCFINSIVYRYSIGQVSSDGAAIRRVFYEHSFPLILGILLTCILFLSSDDAVIRREKYSLDTDIHLYSCLMSKRQFYLLSSRCFCLAFFPVGWLRRPMEKIKPF